MDKEEILLSNARAFYLNEGEVNISDEYYDNLMKELGYTNLDIYEKLDLTKNTNHNFKLEQPVLRKVKINDYDNLPSTFINTPKYDGSSIEVIYENGNLKAVLSSSGILQTKKLYNHVPKYVDSRITRVYCEAVVDINKYGDTARQYSNGLINSVYKQDEVNENLYLVAFNCKLNNLISDKDYDLKMSILRNSILPRNFTITSEFNEYYLLSNDLTTYKLPELGIDVFIDGVVSYSSYDSFINKLYYNNKKVSTVENIELIYQGNTDLYSAKLNIKPIKLEGVNIRRIAASANRLKSKRMGIGAKIEVFRSGSTIPKEGKVMVPSDEFDLKCKCGTELSFDYTVGNNFKCPNKNCKNRYDNLVNMLEYVPIYESSFNFLSYLKFTGFNAKRIRDTFKLDEAIELAKSGDLNGFMDYVRNNVNLTNSQVKVLELNSIALLELIKKNKI